MSPRSPDSNIVPQLTAVSRDGRERLNGHRGCVVWLTGRPSSGKTTLANAAATTLHDARMQTAVLDGDNIRLGLCADLGFSEADRNENVRRVAEMARHFLDSGVIVFVALVSPYRNAREKARQIIGCDDFIEVYCECESTACETRDAKGHYARAKLGEIPNFTGVSSDYEEPLSPGLLLQTSKASVVACVRGLTDLIVSKCSLSNNQIIAIHPTSTTV